MTNLIVECPKGPTPELVNKMIETHPDLISDGVALYSAHHPGDYSLWASIKAFFKRAKLSEDALESIEIDFDAPP